MADNSDPDDYWGKAISLFTGYEMPSRKALFDKLKSKEGIPLFRMDIQDMPIRPIMRNEDYTAVSGWNTHEGEDYDLVFYAAGGDGAGHKDVKMRRVRIVMIGIVSTDGGRGRLLDAGEKMTGVPFKGKYGDEWDNTGLAQYIGGAQAALDALVNQHSTKGLSYNGVSIADADAVDLKSFERTAQAFDRATQFFVDHAKTLEQWEASLGDEQAGWKGQAAGIFWNLVHTLNKNYQSYVEQLGGPEFHAANTTVDGYTPKSKFGDSLAAAQRNLYDEAKQLREAWQKWADSREHDPHRPLLEILDLISAWVLNNNTPYVVKHTTTETKTENQTTTSSEKVEYETSAPFKQHHPDFGDLNDVNSWKAVGEKAVELWNKYVNEMLVPVATQSISDLNGDWIDAGENFEEPLETKNTTSLSENYEKDVADKEKAAAKKESDDAKNEAEKDKEEAKKEAEKAKEDAKRDADDAKKEIKESLNGGGGGGGGPDDIESLFNTGGGAEGAGGEGPDGAGGGGGKDGTTTTSVDDFLNGGTGGSDPNTGPGGSGSSTDLPPPPATSVDDLLNGGGAGDPTGGGAGGTEGGTGGGPGGGPALVIPPLTTDTSTLLNGQPNSNSGKPPVLGTDGPGTSLDDDGGLVHDYPDGSHSVFDPETGDLTVTDPDGHDTVTHLNPGDTFTNPDGSETQLNPDGTLTTDFPDGHSEHFDPSDGTLQTTNPDGSTTTTDLNSGLGDGSSIHLPNGPGGSSSLDESLNDTSGLTDQFDDFADYDASPFSGGTLGGPSSALDDQGGSTGGTPLNPGGMGGMGGMGGAGAGGAGGGSSNGERVRNVLGDSGGASLRRPTSSLGVMDGEDMALRRGGPATSSSGGPMGGAPMGGAGQGGQSTESGDRQRSTWLAEDEDIWGTDEGGAPAVIG